MNTTPLQTKINDKAENDLKKELNELLYAFKQGVYQLTGHPMTTRIQFQYYEGGNAKVVNATLDEIVAGITPTLMATGLPRRINRDTNAFIETVSDLKSRMENIESQLP